MSINTILKNAIQRLVGWKVTKMEVRNWRYDADKYTYTYEAIATTNGCKNRYKIVIDMLFTDWAPHATLIGNE